jgi:hypothetical protein
MTPILIAVLLGGCSKPDNRPPGLRLLMEKRKKLHVGMTIAEVDAVMAGHPRREDRAAYPGVNGRDFPQPSALAIDYGDKPGSTEGDYGLMAYFDKDGRLLDTSIGEYLK